MNSLLPTSASSKKMQESNSFIGTLPVPLQPDPLALSTLFSYSAAPITSGSRTLPRFSNTSRNKSALDEESATLNIFT
jgi:hypothetical protein